MKIINNKSEIKITTESVWHLFCCKLQPYIMKWVSDPEVAKDIEQEVFLKIHENIDTLRDDAKVHSWVLQITKNIIFDYFRKQKAIKGNLLMSDVEDHEVPLINFNERDLELELTSGLSELIETLPPKYSQALKLVELEGLSQVELAKKLNISVSGAKSRVQRARQMVKDTLMECCHYEFDKYGNVIGVQPKKCCCCNN